MILAVIALDVGNTHIHGGVFIDNEIKLRFRYVSTELSSDQLGVFLKSVLRENGVDDSHIVAIAIASVVPSVDYSIRSACLKYFSIDPFFIKLGVKTGVQIQTKHPQQVGADLVAGCVGAMNRLPGQSLVVADFGTATTLCAITHDKKLKGAVILPGLRTMMRALQMSAEQLPSVEITDPGQCLGNDTVSAIQVGIFQSQRCMLQELPKLIAQAHFSSDSYHLVGTGGFSHLFSDIFHLQNPDLVLEGINAIYNMNMT